MLRVMRATRSILAAVLLTGAPCSSNARTIARFRPGYGGAQRHNFYSPPPRLRPHGVRAGHGLRSRGRRMRRNVGVNLSLERAFARRGLFPNQVCHKVTAADAAGFEYIELRLLRATGRPCLCAGDRASASWRALPHPGLWPRYGPVRADFSCSGITRLNRCDDFAFRPTLHLPPLRSYRRNIIAVCRAGG
jgi:hypothetical protein